MRAPVPDLHPKLVATLDAFGSEGVELSPAEIAWLAQLRRECDRSADGSVPWVIGAPLDYAGVVWWPLHRRAESWFMRADKLMAGSDFYRVLVFLYAHTKSAPGDTSLIMTMGENEIRRTVKDWFSELALHRGQVNALAERLSELNGNDSAVPDPMAKEQERPQVRDDVHGFVATMCKAFPGVVPDYWLSGIGADDARKMLENVAHDGPWATSPARVEAQKNYLKAVKWLWMEHECS